MTATGNWANSGDSHVLEPADTLYEALPRHLALRLPRSERDGDTEIIHVDGRVIRRRIPRPITEGEHEGLGFVEAMMRPPGARDLRARLTDLDAEGIWAEVVYPSLTMWNGFIEDRHLLRAAVRVINDWMHAEVAGASARLVPTAQLPLRSVGDAVAELNRCADLGFRACFVPTGPPSGEPPFHDPHWDPIWAAMEDAGMVLAVHIGSDSDPTGADGGGAGGYDVIRYRGRGGALLNYVDTTWTGQRITAQLVASGVLDRHPNLRLLVSEGGAAWVPFLADRLGEAHRQHSFAVSPKLRRSPREILFTQVYASFQHDESAVPAMTAMGYRNVMWGSDYPHLEGTYGHTREVLHSLFAGVDDGVRRRITVESFLDLFPEVGEPPIGWPGFGADDSAGTAG